MKNKILKHFYLKEVKKNRKGQAPIYLRITINGQRAEMSTDQKIKPELWDKVSERVVGRNEDARTINTALTTLLAKVDKYYTALDVKDERISVGEIIEELKGRGINQMTIVQAYNYHINKMDELVGINYEPTTVKRYKSCLVGLKDFMKTALHKTDLRLCDLNNEFIESYYTYLRNNKGLKQNTTAKCVKNLFRVINKAIVYKWLVKNPFKGFVCNYVDPGRGYLSQDEIDAICNKELSIPRLRTVRDLFIFQIYTGLSFIDMAGLTDQNIETRIDGSKWVVVNRKKTGVISSIPLLPRASEILEKYRADPLLKSRKQVLPVYSNQRMNGYLKEIGDICKITKSLSTHLARHTFATTITLTNGVPIETVSKMLGHSSLKTTQIYSKVIDKKIADDTSRLPTCTTIGLSK